MNRLRFLLVPALLAIFPLSASAWTRAADERIAKKAAALAPPDLRLVIERFEGDYLRGIERARRDEGTETHHYLVKTRSGRLRQKIEGDSRAIAQALRGNKPMAEIVEQLGALSHYVADANNPFHVANDPVLTPSYDDYARYFERRMTKFPTVFYGLTPRFELGAYLDRTFARSARFHPLIREEYFRHGERRTSADFDDRSTAFGIASICYSRSVSDLVNLYYFIWKEAGGDVRTTQAMARGNLLLNAN